MLKFSTTKFHCDNALCGAKTQYFAMGYTFATLGKGGKEGWNHTFLLLKKFQWPFTKAVKLNLLGQQWQQGLMDVHLESKRTTRFD